MPARIVVVSAKSSSKTQGPRVSRGESASWPMTAMEEIPSPKGRTGAPAGPGQGSFLSRTRDFSAARRAASRWAGSARIAGAAAASA